MEIIFIPAPGSLWRQVDPPPQEDARPLPTPDANHASVPGNAPASAVPAHKEGTAAAEVPVDPLLAAPQQVAILKQQVGYWKAQFERARERERQALNSNSALQEQLRIQAIALAAKDKKIQELEAELARLQKTQKKKPRSNDQPSNLEKKRESATTATPKQRGKPRRAKTPSLTIHETVSLSPSDLPPGSILIEQHPYVVQDLHVISWNTRYLIEVWLTPNGERRCGELPAGIHGHYGPGVNAFVLQQHYEGKVTQPQLHRELQDFGVQISIGQIHNLLTADRELFHAEKDAVLATGLQESSYVNVDDSGAPHQGKYGSCLLIGNEWFSSFHSSETKSRPKFLDVLRCGHTDYLLDDLSWDYLRERGLPPKVLQQLQTHAVKTFADLSAWEQHLEELAIAPSNRQLVTEAALLSSVIAHGVSPTLGIISDGAEQYALLTHGLCWWHQSRNLAKLEASGTAAQQEALSKVLDEMWQLYQDLKKYQESPSQPMARELTARYEAWVKQETCYPELNAALKRLQAHQEEMLRVLERPEMPLHNNTGEKAFRDWATKRKVSAGTRSELGRKCRDTFMSLKGTCEKLGVRFWEYLHDRLQRTQTIPPLAELVRQKAEESRSPKEAAVLA